jgi:hypothetical protein
MSKSWWTGGEFLKPSGSSTKYKSVVVTLAFRRRQHENYSYKILILLKRG